MMDNWVMGNKGVMEHERVLYEELKWASVWMWRVDRWVSQSEWVGEWVVVSEGRRVWVSEWVSEWWCEWVWMDVWGVWG